MNETNRELLELAALEEAGARRVAEIMGPSSAAAAALMELEACRARGFAASITRRRGAWLVVRDLKAAETD